MPNFHFCHFSWNQSFQCLFRCSLFLFVFTWFQTVVVAHLPINSEVVFIITLILHSLELFIYLLQSLHFNSLTPFNYVFLLKYSAIIHFLKETFLWLSNYIKLNGLQAILLLEKLPKRNERHKELYTNVPGSTVHNNQKLEAI